MKYAIILVFTLLSAHLSKAQPSAKEILDKSIAYHDPQSQWSTFNQILSFNEKRPDGTEKKATVEIDNNRGFVSVNRDDEMIISMTNDQCEIIKGDKDCEYASMIRNYYLYLWGLPMKLLDENTPLDSEVKEVNYLGEGCYRLRVPYEKDIWYFYISRDSYRMIAYQFYKDEQAKKGEYILLEGEVSLKGLKIPKARSWYTLPDSTYLGVDILENIK